MSGEQYSQQYAGAAKAATEGELKGAAKSAHEKHELKGAAATAASGQRIGGNIPIGEKDPDAGDPDYIPRPGEQATEVRARVARTENGITACDKRSCVACCAQEELASADYESGAPKGPLRGAPARNVERQARRRSGVVCFCDAFPSLPPAFTMLTRTRLLPLQTQPGDNE